MPASDYERGRVQERLAGHDKHFELIDGTMKDVATNLAKLNMGVQQIIDSAESDRKTVITTAKALRDAEDARRDKVEAKWTPVQRLVAVLGAMGACSGIVVAILHH